MPSALSRASTLMQQPSIAPHRPAIALKSVPPAAFDVQIVRPWLVATAPSNHRPRSNPHRRALARGFVLSAFFDAGPLATPPFRAGPAPKNASEIPPSSLDPIMAVLEVNQTRQRCCQIFLSEDRVAPKSRHGQAGLPGQDVTPKAALRAEAERDRARARHG
jgi:hypothetical protein